MAPRASMAVTSTANHKALTRAGTQLAALIGEPVRSQEPTSEIDAHDLRVGVIVGMGWDFLSGRVVECLDEAKDLTGEEKLEMVDRAARYLQQLRLQARGDA